MKIRVIFLLFVFGAVTVLAGEANSEEKTSTEEKGDEKENESSKESGKKEPKGLGKAHKTLENIDRRIQSLLTRGDGYFHWMLETTIENKNKFKKILEGKFQTLGLTIQAQQFNEIRKAINDGKDEVEIQECFNKQKFDLEKEMRNDLKETEDCFTEATEEAQKILTELRNIFLDVTKKRIKEIEKKVEILKTCLERNDGSCLQETTDLRETFNKTHDLVDLYKKNGEKGLEEQVNKMIFCREKFLENMSQVGDGYFTLMNTCTNS